MLSTKSLLVFVSALVAFTAAQSCPAGTTPTTITLNGQTSTVCCSTTNGVQTCQDPLTGSQVPANKRRHIAERRHQLYLEANPACPADQRACALPSGNFECVEFNELTSCGGCTSNGTGVDCLSLAGTNGVGCIDDHCVAFSCSSGYELLHHTCHPKLG
ncbi:hypothetical protein MNV49_002685 [Pseudohyphozyma bogoriensis]|nr:hypothetical protein MNV49_002685 [Pseudohyphozyma bogoriensis]